jgi:hypothetical protein
VTKVLVSIVEISNGVTPVNVPELPLGSVPVNVHDTCEITLLSESTGVVVNESIV